MPKSKKPQTGLVHKYLKVSPSKKLTIPQLERAAKSRNKAVSNRAKIGLQFAFVRKASKKK